MARKMTMAQRVVRFLESRGSVEVQGKSHYRQFTRPGREPGTFYFVGTMGAVRVGRCASKSMSVTEGVHRIVEKWEVEQGL